MASNHIDENSNFSNGEMTISNYFNIYNRDFYKIETKQKDVENYLNEKERDEYVIKLKYPQVVQKSYADEKRSLHLIVEFRIFFFFL